MATISRAKERSCSFCHGSCIAFVFPPVDVLHVALSQILLTRDMNNNFWIFFWDDSMLSSSNIHYLDPCLGYGSL